MYYKLFIDLVKQLLTLSLTQKPDDPVIGTVNTNNVHYLTPFSSFIRPLPTYPS